MQPETINTRFLLRHAAGVVKIAIACALLFYYLEEMSSLSCERWVSFFEEIGQKMALNKKTWE